MQEIKALHGTSKWKVQALSCFFKYIFFFKLWNPLPQKIVDIKRLYGLKEKSDKFTEEIILQGMIKYKALTLVQGVPKPKFLGKVFLRKCQLYVLIPCLHICY